MSCYPCYQQCYPQQCYPSCCPQQPCCYPVPIPVPCPCMPPSCCPCPPCQPCEPTPPSNPCCPKPKCSVKKSCCGGTGPKIICLPRGCGPCGPPVPLCCSAPCGHSIPCPPEVPPQQEQAQGPSSFNNCNFYCSELPKGFPSRKGNNGNSIQGSCSTVCKCNKSSAPGSCCAVCGPGPSDSCMIECGPNVMAQDVTPFPIGRRKGSCDPIGGDGGRGQGHDGGPGGRMRGNSDPHRNMGDGPGGRMPGNPKFSNMGGGGPGALANGNRDEFGNMRKDTGERTLGNSDEYGNMRNNPGAQKFSGTDDYGNMRKGTGGNTLGDRDEYGNMRKSTGGKTLGDLDEYGNMRKSTGRQMPSNQNGYGNMRKSTGGRTLGDRDEYGNLRKSTGGPMPGNLDGYGNERKSTGGKTLGDRDEYGNLRKSTGGQMPGNQDGYGNMRKSTGGKTLGDLDEYGNMRKSTGGQMPGNSDDYGNNKINGRESQRAIVPPYRGRSIIKDYPPGRPGTSADNRNGPRSLSAQPSRSRLQSSPMSDGGMVNASKSTHSMPQGQSTKGAPPSARSRPGTKSFRGTSAKHTHNIDCGQDGPNYPIGYRPPPMCEEDLLPLNRFPIRESAGGSRSATPDMCETPPHSPAHPRARSRSPSPAVSRGNRGVDAPRDSYKNPNNGGSIVRDFPPRSSQNQKSMANSQIGNPSQAAARNPSQPAAARNTSGIRNPSQPAAARNSFGVRNPSQPAPRNASGFGAQDYGSASEPALKSTSTGQFHTEGYGSRSEPKFSGGSTRPPEFGNQNFTKRPSAAPRNLSPDYRQSDQSGFEPQYNNSSGRNPSGQRKGTGGDYSRNPNAGVPPSTHVLVQPTSKFDVNSTQPSADMVKPQKDLRFKSQTSSEFEPDNRAMNNSGQPGRGRAPTPYSYGPVEVQSYSGNRQPNSTTIQIRRYSQDGNQFSPPPSPYYQPYPNMAAPTYQQMPQMNNHYCPPAACIPQECYQPMPNMAAQSYPPFQNMPPPPQQFQSQPPPQYQQYPTQRPPPQQNLPFAPRNSSNAPPNYPALQNLPFAPRNSSNAPPNYSTQQNLSFAPRNSSNVTPNYPAQQNSSFAARNSSNAPHPENPHITFSPSTASSSTSRPRISGNAPRDSSDQRNSSFAPRNSSNAARNSAAEPNSSFEPRNSSFPPRNPEYTSGGFPQEQNEQSQPRRSDLSNQQQPGPNTTINRNSQARQSQPYAPNNGRQSYGINNGRNTIGNKSRSSNRNAYPNDETDNYENVGRDSVRNNAGTSYGNSRNEPGSRVPNRSAAGQGNAAQGGPFPLPICPKPKKPKKCIPPGKAQTYGVTRNFPTRVNPHPIRKHAGGQEKCTPLVTPPPKFGNAANSSRKRKAKRSSNIP